MRARQEGFVHKVTSEPWGLSEPSKTVVRRVKDMKECFMDCPDDPETEIYRVVSPAEEEPSDMTFALTVIKPGKIGSEFHMTKGHFHKRQDAGEVYIGMAGEGWLLLQDRLGTVTRLEISGGEVAYVPPAVAHRAVNTGRGDLVFLAVYSPDAGHDYDSIVRRGFAKRAVEKDGKAILEDKV